MKAFKHKNSTNDNPLWGKAYAYGFVTTDRIDVWHDNEVHMMDELMLRTPKSDQFEIVDITITVLTP
jgi:hypothetical protein